LGTVLVGNSTTNLPYTSSYQLVIDGENQNKVGFGINATDNINYSFPVKFQINFASKVSEFKLKSETTTLTHSRN